MKPTKSEMIFTVLYRAFIIETQQQFGREPLVEEIRMFFKTLIEMGVEIPIKEPSNDC